MEIRGFDSYDVSLGDEMRGERASLGKSLEDAERDLRIKAKVITAIENCDLSGFTNQSVIAGYVRSYAKYLGMDAEDCYTRFCAESGYRSPAAMMAQSGSAFASNRAEPSTSRTGLHIADSRFAAPPSRNRFRARVSLGAVTSALALLALIAGLSYGGYALLQDIQRVGFAPLPEAPTVVADAPQIDAPAVSTPEDDKKPMASAYAGGGALAASRPPSDLSPGPRPRRDGPISSIDPRNASLFSRAAPSEPTTVAGTDATADAALLAARNELRGDPMTRMGAAIGPGAGPEAETVPRIARLDSEPDAGRLEGDPMAAGADVTPQTDATTPAERGIALLAAGEAWVEVSDRDKAIVFTGILKPGQEVRLPDQILSPKMISGNAGNTYVIVDGVAFGPLGALGAVRKNFDLTPQNIVATLPEADLVALRSSSGGGTVTEVAPVARADEKMVMPRRRPER